MLILALWKMIFTKLLLNRKIWMMLEIIDKNVFRTMTIIWYLFVGFMTIILRSLHYIRFLKICFLLKYGSWKPQLESRNSNQKSLNWTLLLIWISDISKKSPNFDSEIPITTALVILAICLCLSIFGNKSLILRWR